MLARNVFNYGNADCDGWLLPNWRVDTLFHQTIVALYTAITLAVGATISTISNCKG